jgi:hypothetical protein
MSAVEFTNPRVLATSGHVMLADQCSYPTSPRPNPTPLPCNASMFLRNTIRYRAAAESEDGFLQPVYSASGSEVHKSPNALYSIYSSGAAPSRKQPAMLDLHDVDAENTYSSVITEQPQPTRQSSFSVSSVDPYIRHRARVKVFHGCSLDVSLHPCCCLIHISNCCILFAFRYCSSQCRVP